MDDEGVYTDPRFSMTELFSTEWFMRDPCDRVITITLHTICAHSCCQLDRLSRSYTENVSTLKLLTSSFLSYGSRTYLFTYLHTYL